MKIFFTTVLLFLLVATKAQNIHAVIKDSVTQQPVLFAGITNISSGKTVMSNKTGSFSIAAKANDIISIAAVGYSFDTIHIVAEMLAGKEINFSIHPLSHQLPDVLVNTKGYSLYQFDSLERRKDFFGTMNQHTQPVASLANSGAGLGINLDHFYKADRDKRNRLNMFTAMEKEQYINYRFTPALVSKYTNFSTDSTLQFMQQYRPDYSWLRTHTAEEDLLYHINDKLKLFLKK